MGEALVSEHNDNSQRQSVNTENGKNVVSLNALAGILR